MSNLEEPNTIWETVVDHCADVVSFFPSPFDDTFLCGEYELLEEKDERVGGIVVYKFDGENCTVFQNIPSTGVLDVRWLQNEDCTYLVSALADGKITLASVDSTEGTLSEVKSINASHNSSIIMSLDGSDLDFGMIATCDTSGFLTMQNLFQSNSVTQWNAHEYEIWAVAFDKHDPNRLFSGGDDCSLKCWDFRTDLSKAVFQSQQHSMGVTSLAVSLKSENQLISGSYDEYVKQWDCRNMKSCVKEVKVGGGVWRLRWNQNEDILIAACMHNGVKVLNSDFSEISSYSKHKSLAYGVDIKHSPLQTLIVSCSFYDKGLHLWKLE